MTTHAGTSYKPQEEMEIERSIKLMEEVMAQLIEDSQKREEEMVSECASCDAEIMAKCKARERSYR